jgi:pseudouridine synthase
MPGNAPGKGRAFPAPPLERLHKVLARSGVASRRQCEQLIAGGQVTVDGKVVTEMGFKVDPARAKIVYAGQPVRPPRTVTLVLNKPRRVMTTTKDDRERPTVMGLLGDLRERVYPVGRLDWDSEGLLILTNDGELANLLTHPRYGVPRTYHVRVRGELTPEVLDKLGRGVWLAEGKTGPVKVLVKKRDREGAIVEVTVREGMNREVRRVFARFGLKVRRLKRLRIGPLNLGDLPSGRFRILEPREVEALRAAATRAEEDHERP